MRIISFIFLLVFTLVACQTSLQNESEAPSQSTEASPVSSELPVLGKAPELNNEVWLNTDQPLRLADLGGQVVLLEMWTFG
jgi:hypothetical protein